MQKDPGIPDPFIKKGDPISAKNLCAVARAARRFTQLFPGTFSGSGITIGTTPRGGGGSTTTTSVSIQIVLIDADIEGVEEVLYEDDEQLETPDGLILYAYARREVELKYFREAQSEEVTSGLCVSAGADTIELDETASSEDNAYRNFLIRINDEVANITDYDGTTKVATVFPPWGVTPIANDIYTIYDEDPGYDPDKTVMILACNTDDDEPGSTEYEPDYLTTTVFYDDGKDFIVGTYKKSDYPDYPENEAFPPDGYGTYDIAPDGYFNKRYRGIAINRVLVTGLCQVLPPPPLSHLLGSS